LIGIGSILGRACHRRWFNRRINVWGTGFIEDGEPIRSPHRFHAVRGWRTASRLKNVEIKTVGDPGLLVGKLLPDFASIEKTARLGIVPHYKERDSAAAHELAAQLPGTTIIDIFLPTLEYLRSVAGCEVILSSSLHGLIVADAFGIPNAWIQLSELVRGAGFKYEDYYSVFPGVAAQPLDLSSGLTESLLREVIERYQRPGLADVQRAVLESFPFPIHTREEPVCDHAGAVLGPQSAGQANVARRHEPGLRGHV
jgi:pyruvyltransferase